MRFFTQAWASGRLSDAKVEANRDAYWRYVEILDPADRVTIFAKSVNLHDGYLDRLSQRGGRLELRLLTGDLQVGYWHTTLIYGDARIGLGEAVVAEGLAKRPTEIWYDEFSGAQPRMAHHFLLAPRGRGLKSAGEFRIDFSSFDFTQSPADDRILPPPDAAVL